MLETDFFETSPKYKPYSMEDDRFLGFSLTESASMTTCCKVLTFMNDLLGILCRFRIVFMTDIKSMLHHFVVAEEDRDLLRFLWWLDGDPPKEVIDYIV